MRPLLIVFALVLLAGCESIPPSLQGLPVDVTRNAAISDPTAPRHFVFVPTEQVEDNPAATEAGQKAITDALTERGWTLDPNRPTATVSWNWGSDPRQLSTEWGWSETTYYYPSGFFYPYGFYPGPFMGPGPMVSVTHARYPIWLTVVIRDPTASPTATPLFEGKISTALTYPADYAGYVPLLVNRLFKGFLKVAPKPETKESPASAP